VADEPDREVLEALMLHLLADSKFNMTGVSSNGTVIVLHARTQATTGFLTPQQMRSGIGEHDLPSDAEQDFRRRNVTTGSYTNLTFAPGITVADLNIWGSWRLSRAFEDANPKARGWMVAYLPGYSTDGTRAVVYAGVGPSPHGAVLTALLAKRDSKWVVKWDHITWYL
jgi:hypothetical protein